MNLDDEDLLDNVLQAFDRLYDCKSVVEDAQALLFATAKALSDGSWATEVADVADALQRVLEADAPVDEARRLALVAVQPLRERIAQAIYGAFVVVVKMCPTDEADREFDAWLSQRGLRRADVNRRDLQTFHSPHSGERGYAIRRTLVDENNMPAT